MVQYTHLSLCRALCVYNLAYNYIMHAQLYENILHFCQKYSCIHSIFTISIILYTIMPDTDFLYIYIYIYIYILKHDLMELGILQTDNYIV